MHVDRDIVPLLDRSNCANMIEVRVRQPDGSKGKLLLLNCGKKTLRFLPRVNQDSLFRNRTSQHITVFLQRTNNQSLQN